MSRKVKFNVAGMSHEHEIINGVVKIYQVPQDYSDDQVYIADYGKTSVEPVPACFGGNANLLFYAEVSVSEDGTASVTEVLNSIGAEIVK